MGFLQALYTLGGALSLTHPPGEEHCPLQPLYSPPHLTGALGPRMGGGCFEVVEVDSFALACPCNLGCPRAR